jgi:S1-C subfamily serine protease
MLGDRVYFETFRKSAIETFEFRRVYGRIAHAHARAVDGLEQRIMTLDVSSWPGVSGSPVFSKAGQVVGVVTAGRAQTGEAVFRDARWILQLLKAAQGDKVPHPGAAVIDFPARPRAPATNARVPHWAQRLMRFLISARSRSKIITLQLR